MIQRISRIRRIEEALKRSPVVLLSGPRQCGKTTLAREFVALDSLNYFDCEDPRSLARLEEPMTALSSLEGIVVIDEVQRRPDLFPVLRVLADRPNANATFLVLGSASGSLLRQTSESLAGRVEVVAMQGFTLGEIDESDASQLWLRGGFPRSFLAATDDDSWMWRKQFAATLVERDLPSWGVRVPSSTLLRFWQMLAHYHGQIWNAADIARSMGLSEPTVRSYLDIMTDALVVRQLQPYHVNIAKRQVRSPKIYMRDTGLLHQLLSIRSNHDLLHHPKSGASWEGWIIEEILASVEPDSFWFWATHSGAEIDLYIELFGRKIGIECKRTDHPKVTRSIRQAITDLQLDEVIIVHSGDSTFPLADNVQAMSVQSVVQYLAKC